MTLYALRIAQLPGKNHYGNRDTPVSMWTNSVYRRVDITAIPIALASSQA
jgi:hypothetical protein